MRSIPLCVCALMCSALLCAPMCSLAASAKENTQETIDWITEKARQGVDSTEQAIDSLADNRDDIAQSVQDGWDKAEKWWNDLKNSSAAKVTEQAIDWLVEKANNGSALAQRKLAELYLSGTGVEQDEQKALYWLKKSCDNGDSQACILYRQITTRAF